MDISSSFNRYDIITNQYFNGNLEDGTWITNVRLKTVDRDVNNVDRNKIMLRLKYVDVTTSNGIESLA